MTSCHQGALPPCLAPDPKQQDYFEHVITETCGKKPKGKKKKDERSSVFFNQSDGGRLRLVVYRAHGTNRLSPPKSPVASDDRFSLLPLRTLYI